MKELNRRLLNQLHEGQIPVKVTGGSVSLAQEDTLYEPSNMPEAAEQIGASNIHSLYQDLYLTDLKNDLGDVESDL